MERKIKRKKIKVAQFSSVIHCLQATFCDDKLQPRNSLSLA